MFQWTVIVFQIKAQLSDISQIEQFAEWWLNNSARLREQFVNLTSSANVSQEVTHNYVLET